MHWHPMRVEHLPRIARLGSLVHPPHLDESVEAMRSRFSLGGPHFCFSLMEDKVLGGYALAHPWDRDTIPKLDETLAPPDRLGGVFIHDVAIDLPYRRRGYGHHVVSAILERSRRLAYGPTALVAVNGTQSFWEALGFAPEPAPTPLDSYGPGALYMVHGG